MPAASCSGLSATTICMVEQFGLAMIPRWASRASRVDLGRRRAGRRPASASARSCRRRPRPRRRSAAPTRRTSRRRPRRSRGRSPRSSRRAAAGRPMPLRARGRPSAQRRTARPRGPGSDVVSQQVEQHGADLARGADDGDAMALCGARHANSPNGCSGRIVSSPWRSKAVCSARTASGTRSPRHDAADLDGRRRDHRDVDPLLAEHGEDLGGDAGVRLHPRADDRHLPHALVGDDVVERELGLERLERRAGGAQVVARHGERHVRAVAVGVRLVLDDHVHVDVGVGQRGRDAAGGARACRARPAGSRGPRPSSG